MTLEAKNVPLNHPQTWGFQAKKDPPSDYFGPVARMDAPCHQKARCLNCPQGRMNPYEPFQPEIAAMWVTLEAKNVLLNPPQTWGFRLKKTPSSDHFGPTEHALCPPLPDLGI